MDKISTVVFTKDCKIKYTSFTDTLDITKTFVNVDRNALSTYIALYDYATTQSCSKNGVQDPIITATLRNKRKLLLAKTGEIYLTVLIKTSMKYYEIELLRKGLEWICNLIKVDSTIKMDKLMKFFGQERDLFNFYHLYDGIKDAENNYFIYDLDARRVVCDGTDLSSDPLSDWIYFNFKTLTDNKKSGIEKESSNTTGTLLQDNFVVNNIKLPFKFTYDVFNEILGGRENISTNLYASLNEEENEENHNYVSSTHFLLEKQVLEGKNNLIWQYKNFIAVVPVGDNDELELTVLQEKEVFLLKMIDNYESDRFKEASVKPKFHYIIQSLSSGNILLSNFNVFFLNIVENKPENETEQLLVSSSWLSPIKNPFWSAPNISQSSQDQPDTLRNDGVIANLSKEEYKKLVNHLLTITSREKLAMAGRNKRDSPLERFIKLKDYDLVIYITSVNSKFVMVVKDFPLEQPDISVLESENGQTRLQSLHLLGSEAASFIASKI